MRELASKALGRGTRASLTTEGGGARARLLLSLLTTSTSAALPLRRVDMARGE